MTVTEGKDGETRPPGGDRHLSSAGDPARMHLSLLLPRRSYVHQTLVSRPDMPHAEDHGVEERVVFYDNKGVKPCRQLPKARALALGKCDG